VCNIEQAREPQAFIERRTGSGGLKTETTAGPRYCRISIRTISCRCLYANSKLIVCVLGLFFKTILTFFSFVYTCTTFIINKINKLSLPRPSFLLLSNFDVSTTTNDDDDVCCVSVFSIIQE